MHWNYSLVLCTETIHWIYIIASIRWIHITAFIHLIYTLDLYEWTHIIASTLDDLLIHCTNMLRKERKSTQLLSRRSNWITDHIIPINPHEINWTYNTLIILHLPCIKFFQWAAAIAQWIHLRLPSCHPGFESQAHHLCFYHFIFELCCVEKTKIHQKEARIDPLKKFFKYFWGYLCAWPRSWLEMRSSGWGLRQADCTALSASGRSLQDREEPGKVRPCRSGCWRPESRKRTIDFFVQNTTNPVIYVIKLFGGNLNFPKIKKMKNACYDVWTCTEMWKQCFFSSKTIL